MKRKIAAILVAHIADYGRLVADDEEETLRRVATPTWQRTALHRGPQAAP
jgi:hypothetical protein